MNPPDLRAAGRVGVVVDDEPDGPPRVYLAQLPDGPLVVLEGSSAVIWQVATACARADLVRRVAEATGASADEIGAEVERFVGELLDRGFLETVAATTN